LKDENTRLRTLAVNYDDVEKMKLENKLMRIELQKIKLMAASEANSSYM